jgi:hypothetical protein
MGRQPLTYVNFISFRHAENLPNNNNNNKIFSKIYNFFWVIENEVSFGMFRNIPFFKFQISKLNIHLAETRQRTCYANYGITSIRKFYKPLW